MILNEKQLSREGTLWMVGFLPTSEDSVRYSVVDNPTQELYLNPIVIGNKETITPVIAIDEWISVNDTKPKSELNKYWVLFPNGKVVMCHFNDYRTFGGPVNYWQNLNNDDLPMHETKYIEITPPVNPEQSK